MAENTIPVARRPFFHSEKSATSAIMAHSSGIVNPYTNCRRISLANINVIAPGGRTKKTAVKSAVPARPADEDVALAVAHRQTLREEDPHDGRTRPEDVEEAEQVLPVDVVREVVEDDAPAHRERDEEDERQHEHGQPGAVLRAGPRSAA